MRLGSALLCGLGAACLLSLSTGCTTLTGGSSAAPKMNERVDRDPSTPPPLTREMRGVWVATVSNIDWPSEPGLDVETQQAEARAILDRAKEMNINTIVLQVRPAADALYQSDIEPWSYYLTGQQGQAPEPFYDPLEFWINEAHERGMELHAWFNPFRARHGSQRGETASSHVSNTNPEVVKEYGNMLWMDPGEPEARQQTLDVFADVVRRYDLDGIHIDDYFYPYPVDGQQFPDEESYRKYQQQGGELSRNDFRRDAINNLVQQIYEQTKSIKPHVKFGISPFGIWKPGYPESVQGFNQYENLYADVKLWFNEGWCDYWTPQLYWPTSAPQQSYPQLLMWWATQNTENRTLAPGLYTSRVSRDLQDWSVNEIIGQIFITRAFGDYADMGVGNVHFSMRPLTRNTKNIAEELRDKAYPVPALNPPMTWVDDSAPQAPQVTLEQIAAESAEAAVPTTQPIGGLTDGYFGGMNVTTRPAVTGGLRVNIRAQGEQPRWWAIHTRAGGDWELQIVRATQQEVVLQEYGNEPIEIVAVQAIDDAGNESQPAIVNRGASAN